MDIEEHQQKVEHERARIARDFSMRLIPFPPNVVHVEFNLLYDDNLCIAMTIEPAPGKSHLDNPAKPADEFMFHLKACWKILKHRFQRSATRMQS